MNVSYLLEMNARKYPEKEALVMGEQRITYKDWNERAHHLAKVMQTKGVGQGDRVAIMMPNVPEFAVAFFAVVRAGGIVVPIAANLQEEEVVYIVNDCGARGMIVHDALLQQVSGVTDKTECTFYVKTGTAGGKWEGLSEWMAAPVPENIWFDSDELHEDDPFDILYTSGTTGRPKGVRFSHRNVLTVAKMVAVEFEINEDSRILHLMPLSHSAPLHLMFAAGVVVGAAHVFSPQFSPDILLQLTERERTTHFFGAPVAYLLSLQHPDFANVDLSSGKYWIYGGAPLSQTMAEQVERGFGRDKLVCVYGLTEAGPSGTLLFHRDHPDKAGSVGKRAPLFTEVEIVDKNDRPLAPGETGEIRLRSEGNMLGYWNRPQETEKTLKDGWVYSGDMARMDEDGFIWIVDRKKDMIISGGVNIYPKEIELVLEGHPDIRELAVIGVPHPEWGETVKAFIVTKEGVNRNNEEWLQELRRFAQHQLAKHKIPRLVETTDELPRNASGKVLKHRLRSEEPATQ